ncbi:MAG: tRNA preQ1(34) S-adenosylmethionine ribosyltransferase-isomerase QueA [Oscillospiraceae bacterium]|nr:tRNA preQ1(34) S-adenosylmethionine ribosyltransferase-isomerase QueA [Oscillospiraceae bacterium]
MKKSDFYFDLPNELIAQTPIEPRDHSRLLKLSRETGEISHHHFYDILSFLKKGDLLVLNNSRVLPARIYGKTEKGGDIELLLLENHGNDEWETLVKPGKRAREGAILYFSDGLLKGEIIRVLDDGNRIIKFYYDKTKNIYEILDIIGQMPLPPYITEKLKDKERYQTVYSKEIGSSAAPTAGLHFTHELMDKIKEMGVNIAYVTLHVGLGTFRPVKEDNILDHKMHTEHYTLPADTAELINKTHQNGGRVIAVGTTSLRTLEGSFKKLQKTAADDGVTDIFIYPPYKFNVIDALITNFHLPESTLIMLVSAFCGRENTLNAYKVAIEEKYRFFSFGDAMFIS